MTYLRIIQLFKFWHYDFNSCYEFFWIKLIVIKTYTKIFLYVFSTCVSCFMSNRFMFIHQPSWRASSRTHIDIKNFKRSITKFNRNGFIQLNNILLFGFYIFGVVNFNFCNIITFYLENVIPVISCINRKFVIINIK